MEKLHAMQVLGMTAAWAVSASAASLAMMKSAGACGTLRDRLNRMIHNHSIGTHPEPAT